MGESLLAITIITLIVLTIRRARPVILDNPVVIQRPGQYHIKLAAQLNRAQNFIENIAKQFAELKLTQRNLASQYFEVHDPKVFAEGNKFYLLAVTLRDGVLYFQAVNPQQLKQDTDSHLKTVCEFAETVLGQHPLASQAEIGGGKELTQAVEVAAQRCQVTIKILQ
jgi:hypothetical protein